MISKLATNYLRWYTRVSPGLWDLATNAPVELRQHVAAYPPGHKRAMIAESLASMAAGKVRGNPPDHDTLWDWATHSPTFVARADALLNHKRSPASIADLLQRCWQAEYAEVFDATRQFLEQEIAKYD